MAENQNLILIINFYRPFDSFVSKNEGMAEHWYPFTGSGGSLQCPSRWPAPPILSDVVSGRDRGKGAQAHTVWKWLRTARRALKNPLIFKFAKKPIKAGFFGFDLGEPLQSMDESPAKPVSISR